MANEKMRILKMLEEGKITSAEAARLLESGTDTPEAGGAARTGASAPYESRETSYAGREPYASPDSYTGNGPRVSSSGYSSGSAPGSGSGSGTTAGSKFDDFASELSKKFNDFARDLEPKLKSFTDTVAEKTVKLADKISKTFNSEDTRDYRGTYEPRPASSQSGASSGAFTTGFGAAGQATEKSFELAVTAGYNQLNIAGLNGNVLIRGYNGDKITARIYYKPKRGASPSKDVSFMRLGSKYFLNYDEEDFERVAVDAYIPEGMFNILSIGGQNGSVDVSSVRAERMELSAANGSLTLKDLSAGFVRAECSNGALSLSRVAADNADIENCNGAIDVMDIDVAGLKLYNSNGGVIVNIPSLTRFGEYLWSVETSNGKLTANMPAMADLGYHIKASSTLGSVRVGMTGLTYTVNNPTSVDAKTFTYDGAARKARLAFETSNFPLVVN